MARTEDFSSFISKAISSAFKDLHTCLPGIVESFDPAAGTVSVQPAISRLYTDGSEIPLPKLTNVPICIPRAGDFSITLPVKKGDECLLIFSERSIDNWFKEGSVNIPNDFRLHDLTDGFAILGVGSTPNVIPNYDPDNLQVRNSDASVSVTVKPTDELELKAPTKVLVSAPLLECTGDIKDSNGTLDELRQFYNEHTHIGNMGSPTSVTDKPDT